MAAVAEALSRKALAGWGEVTWDDIRVRNSSLDGLAWRAETFRVEQVAGEERQGKSKLVMEVCEQKVMAWMIPFKPRDTQRPWIHLAPAEGSVLFCREYQFATAPVKSGVGLADAAATGERVCPKCFAELGDRRSGVVAEFEVDQLPSVFSAL